MGYKTKVQVVERRNKTRQFYILCPAPLAEALEMEKGERVEWVVKDRGTLEVRRLSGNRGSAGRGRHD
jgi:bifunctional DNA-binding transcriptional regulator/antitoxin component of YhaV-PrlF toxin-antitoxin module